MLKHWETTSTGHLICCVCWWAGVSWLHRWHIWIFSCSFLIFFSFFEVTFSLAVYKSLFSCWLTEERCCQIQASIRHVFSCPFLFFFFFTHKTFTVSVSIQSSFAYAGGGVSYSVFFSFFFVLLSCLNSSTTMISAPSLSCFSGLSSSIFFSFFVCSIVLLFSACFLWWSCIFWNFPLHFVSFFSCSLHPTLRVTCMRCVSIHVHFIAEWSVFVFLLPCPSSGRSCSISAGKLRCLGATWFCHIRDGWQYLLLVRCWGASEPSAVVLLWWRNMAKFSPQVGFAVQVPGTEPAMVLEQWRKIFPPHAGRGSWGITSIAIFLLQQLKFSMQVPLLESSVVLPQWRNETIYHQH